MQVSIYIYYVRRRRQAHRGHWQQDILIEFEDVSLPKSLEDTLPEGRPLLARHLRVLLKFN